MKPSIMKFPMINAIIVALVIAVAGSARSQPLAAAEADPYEIVKAVLETHVVPRIGAFRSVAADLAPAIDNLCRSGKRPARAEAFNKFRIAVEKLAEIEFLRFGPMQQKGMREKLFFWPDPRGILPRQMRQFLAGPEAQSATIETIKKQSAALQGLPALEILLTTDKPNLGPGSESAKNCAVARGIARAIADNAVVLHDDWTREGGWKDRMLRPGSDNDTYKEPSESASELVKALLVGFQLVGDVQVKPRMAATQRATGPYAQSKLTKAHYAAFVSSLHAFYDTLGLERFLADDQAWVKNWADGAWRAIRSSDGVGGKVAGASRSTPPPLRELFDKITGLRKLVARELATASHLTVGFNELDGD